MQEFSERDNELGEDLEKRLMRTLLRHPATEAPPVVLTALSRLLFMSAYALFGDRVDLGTVRKMIDASLDLVELHMREVEGRNVQ